MTPILGGLVGLALGARHALEPDHLAAVGTLVPRSASLRRAALLGATWGAGHTLSIVTLGGGLLMLDLHLPASLGSSLETLVGIMLVVLGIRAARSGARESRKLVTLSPDVSYAHASHEVRQPLSPFLIGLTHGLAGTGAATILATATVADLRTRVVFLAVFGAGSVGGMALIAGLFALPFHRREVTPTYRNHLQTATGLFSLGVGIWWLCRSLYCNFYG